MVKVFRKRTKVRRRKPLVDNSANDSRSISSEAHSVYSMGGESNLSISSTPYASSHYGFESTTDPLTSEDTPRNVTSARDPGENDVMLAMVVYERPAPSLPDSLATWMNCAQALLSSKEMQTLVCSTRQVFSSAATSSRHAVLSAGGFVVHTACLPVTIPLHLAASTTDLVVGVAGGVLEVAIGGSSRGENPSSSTPVEDLIKHAMGAIPFIIDTASRVTHGVGSAAIGLVAPVFGVEQDQKESPREGYATQSGESSAENDSLLHRLRLDIHIPESRSEEFAISRASSSDYSKYLLRVDDIHVVVSPDPADSPRPEIRAMYIDLGTEFSDSSMTADALAKLIDKGLSVASSNVAAHVGVSTRLSDPAPIDWKPEGTTARVVKKISKLPTDQYFKHLEKHVLVWSGTCTGPRHHGYDCQVFLARGVVKRSPREFLHLLWDSNRTNEYNKFSLGRSDVLFIEDNIFSGGNYGAKVIKSETKVPFTNMSVSLSALMHARSFGEGQDKSYVIVSRSLNSGGAGCHAKGTKRVEKSNKNEILLGVNIMRPVPGHPDLTDLISVSQVSSSMVPQFLAFRIGMMGVQDFFKNVR